MRAFWGRHRQLLVLVCAVMVAALSVGFIVGKFVRDGLNSSNKQFQQQLKLSADQQQEKLRAAQVASCGRLNIRTAAGNQNALATWRLNTLFASAVTHPATPRPQSAAERKLTGRFAHRLEDQVASLTWTPTNKNCSKYPTSTQLPVSFSDRQPSRADLPKP